jgi:hypothetical protein
MIDLKNEEIRNAVRDRYSLVARGGESCCSPNGGSSCCGSPAAATLDQASQVLGYGIQELQSLPEGANLASAAGIPRPSRP